MFDEKGLEELRKILPAGYVEKLRIVDPRINHYEFYTEISNKLAKEIASLNSKIVVEKTGIIFKKVKTVKLVGRIGFTVYNVSLNDREALITKHDEEYKKIKEETKDVVF